VVAALSRLRVEARRPRCRVGRCHRPRLHRQPPALDPGIVGCAPDDVRVDMPVRVVFDNYEDVWLPFFEPRA
jgi:hypothetical protein